MSLDVELHVRYRIANAPVPRYPFAHFFVEDVFPQDFYRDMLQRLPGESSYTPIDETGTVGKGSYRERHVCDLGQAVKDEASAGNPALWKGLESWLMSEAFSTLIIEKFRPAIEERFGEGVRLGVSTDCRLVRDFTNYAIPPHTDTDHKLASLLFYLPRDDSKRHLGTSIYAAKDPDFAGKDGNHHSFENFRHVARMPYVSNALFAFLRTDWSFHGVEPIADEGVERNLMLYNIYVRKVMPPRKPEPRFGWPWQAR